MNCGNHNCDWTTCTLCRSARLSVSTFHRASRRSIDWPPNYQQPPAQQNSSACITIDDAFDSICQYMSTTTRQCKRFHRSTLKHGTSDSDILHIKRYHQNQQQQQRLDNPLMQHEDVQVKVAPGTYTVSSGTWGSDRQHTHVVHIKEGQTVDLTFGM